MARRVRDFYEVNDDLYVEGARRRFLLRIPPGHEREVPAPLVVVIHGFMQSPSHQRAMSRWDELAARNGFLTVYPLGTGIPPHWPPSARHPGGPGQTAFVAGVVAEVARRYPVDPDRVYASGMSNGGGLAATLALELPDTFAAVGSVAGLYTHAPGGPTTGRAVPLIAFHGALDRIIPIEGGVRRLGQPLPAVADWMAAYAAHCSCTTHTQETVTPTITRLCDSGGRNGAEVVWYRIADAGHTWPGGVPLPQVITGPTSPDVDATVLTWEFFRAHPRVHGGVPDRGPSVRQG